MTYHISGGIVWCSTNYLFFCKWYVTHYFALGNKLKIDFYRPLSCDYTMLLVENFKLLHPVHHRYLQ